jgi:hypothetical protein
MESGPNQTARCSGSATAAHTAAKGWGRRRTNVIFAESPSIRTVPLRALGHGFSVSILLDSEYVRRWKWSRCG